MNPEWQQLVELGAGVQNTRATATRQESWLLSCLRINAATDYGRRYRFDRIQSVHDFRERVPLISYADLEPEIRRMSNGDADVLFAGLPIAFERTGGSTSGSKLIPYSAQSLVDFRVAFLPWLGASIRQFDITSGSAYFSISPATRQTEVTAGGSPVGLPDGAYLGADAHAAFANIAAVPAWAGEIRDVAEWQLATLYWLVRSVDLALVSIWSPTFLLALLDVLEARAEPLAGLLHDGGGLAGHDLPRDPIALANLDRFRVGSDTRHLWPNLKLVSCWADASSRPFFNELCQRIPHASFQAKGLLSTEGVVAVPGADGRPVLTPDSGFYEFRTDNGELFAAQQLSSGAKYEVVITTSGGLYRYRTGDCVICEEYAGGLPVLRFAGRKGLTCDMVGEKLDEEFVLSCLDDVPGFHMLVPVHTPKPRYVLVVDNQYQHQSSALIDSVESRLARNPQYAYARRIGQLDRLSLFVASKPLDKYAGRLVTTGARLGDLKVTALRAETDWLETFSETAT